MAVFAPVTEADLAQARSDPAFRQKLLQQNLDVLLRGVKKLRATAGRNGDPSANQMREAIELAVRLAELIQGPTPRAKRRS